MMIRRAFILRSAALVASAALLFGVLPTTPSKATSLEIALPPAVYLVLFEGDDVALNEVQRSVLDQVIEDYQSNKRTGLSVTGSYDRTGTAEHRVTMSRLYAETVRDYLVAGGLPESAIELQWTGDAEFAVQTADGVPEQANRNVIVVLDADAAPSQN